jgi:Tfp pilus assembly protein PilF
LRAAAEKAPSNPLVLFHHGMAQLKSGDSAAGKKALEDALKLSSSFPGADEARAALAAP